MLRVLRAYAVYDTEVGYCQGMNFLAGLLLTWMPNEATAFAALVVLMQQRMLRDLYKSDLARLQVTIRQVRCPRYTWSCLGLSKLLANDMLLECL